MADIQKINLKEKGDQITTYWDPKMVGRVNQMMTKIARIKGTFTWHHHNQEDELFYVIDGEMMVELKDQKIQLKSGEMVIIPHGVEHRPVAEVDCLILMFELETTLNTGNVVDGYTKTNIEEI